MDIMQSIGFFVTLGASFFSAYYVVRKARQIIPFHDKEKLNCFLTNLKYEERTDHSFIRFRNVAHVVVQLRDRYSITHQESSIILVSMAILVGISFIHVNAFLYKELCLIFGLAEGQRVVVGISSILLQVWVYTSMYRLQESILPIATRFEYNSNKRTLLDKNGPVISQPARWKVIVTVVTLLAALLFVMS